MSERADKTHQVLSDEVKLVPPDALRGVSVGISVSDSADLERLGLTSRHCEMAVAELARAVFLAGGTLVYGGRLVPLGGFTDILVDEVRRYREDRDALVLCVPESEHRRLNNRELQRVARALSSSVELICLDVDGAPIDINARIEAASPPDAQRSLSAMRRHITDRCHARVLVGGRLSGFEGTSPGVVEEAVLSLAARRPLYVAGGFGGAAAAVAAVLDSSAASWFPSGFPEGGDVNVDALERVREAAASAPSVPDGLTWTQRQQLAVTHRPGDIASLVVLGLSRVADDDRAFEPVD
jgi:hypothetical protein